MRQRYDASSKWLIENYSDAILRLAGVTDLVSFRPMPGEVVQSRQLPDGPFDADGFRFDGVEVRFGRAALQYRLIQSLWNEACSAPASPRAIEEVLLELYGDDNETEDSTFRQLCTDTRKKFEANQFPLTIVTVQGKVHFIPVS